MTIAELKALSDEDREQKIKEQQTFWRMTNEIHNEFLKAESPEEKAIKIGRFNVLVDNADLVIP